MRRIALFVFHDRWELCRDRLRLLRRFNPGLEVHGLFGGAATELAAARAHLAGELRDVWHLAGRDARWKWANTDLAVRAWFIERGHALDFDVLHVVQWDLLFLAPLESLFAGVPPGAVGLTGPTPLDAIADRWAWLNAEPLRSDSLRFLEIARLELGFSAEPLVCLGPGYCLPRAFLERYAKTEVPEVGHDELRLPTFARLFGYEIADTGFYPRWFDAPSERIFNANGGELDPADVALELTRWRGRRAFHPCRDAFDSPTLAELLRTQAAPTTSGPRPRVTVLMFACDLRELAPAALDGVLAQRADFDWDVLVGDDCSVDGTRELLLDYQARHSDRIRLVLPPARLGGGGVPLFAEVFRAARGEYLAYCDCDDYWTSPTKLARQIELLERHPEHALCFHDCAVLAPDGSFDAADYTPKHVAAVSRLEDLWFDNFIASCSAVIRRDALPELPEWYARVRWGDWARYLLAAEHGSIAYIAERWGVYRLRAGGAWSGLSRVEQLESVIEFLLDVDRRLGGRYAKQVRRAVGWNRLRLAAALRASGRPVAAWWTALRGRGSTAPAQ